MGKLDYIPEGQMNIFDFVEEVKPIRNPGAGALFRLLRYGPHTMVPEAVESCRKYIEHIGGVENIPTAPPYDFSKAWTTLPCKNCEYYDGVCRAGGHSVHYEYDKFLICDAFKQTIDAKPKCQHSGHECNRQELWKVADTLDELQCPHVCCRKCNTVGCGARCNGSEKPQKPKERDCDKCDIEFGSITCFERRGYVYDRAHREWIRDESGNQLRSAIDKRECLKEFEEPEPKAEQQTTTEVTKKSCSNCLRFNMEIEQPPDGWGHIGYCAEHNSKTNDISYCQSWEPKPVEVVAYTAKEYAKAIVKHLIDYCRSWGMSEKISQLREKRTAELFYKLFCKITRTYYVTMDEWYFNVEFCKDNTVQIKRCGRDYNNRPLDATIQLQDVLNEF